MLISGTKMFDAAQRIIYKKIVSACAKKNTTIYFNVVNICDTKARWQLLSAFVCIIRRRFINIIDVNDISIKPYKVYKDDRYSWTDNKDSRNSIKGFGIIYALKTMNNDYLEILFFSDLWMWVISIVEIVRRIIPILDTESIMILKTIPLNHWTSWIGNPETGQWITNLFPSIACTTLGKVLSGELVGGP